MNFERCCAVMLAVLATAMTGCTDLRPYHADQPDQMAGPDGATPYSRPPSEPNDCSNDTKKTCISFVEYDDFGHLYNRAQLDQTLAYARQIASRGAVIVPPPGTKQDAPRLAPKAAPLIGPQIAPQAATADRDAPPPPSGGIVVVYVHGWHHDARDKDTDLRHFKDAIAQAGEMDQESFHDNRRIMGIYVGWRGESVDVFPANILTFWDRKNTAQAVGDGAVFELFRKLANIREKYPTSRLVVIGHSFGAAVAYSAVSHAILGQIIDDPEPPLQTEIDRKRWDMVVLVNPAFEAMQVRPQFEAARSREYMMGQLPHVIFVTSQADWGTRDAFPAGRHVSTVFKGYADDVSSAMNTTAIGHYIPYVTHQLVVNKALCDVEPEGRIISPINNLAHVVNTRQYCFGDHRAMIEDKVTKEKGQPSRITRCDTPELCAEVAPGHVIRRGLVGVQTEETDPTPERMPIMNVRTTREVMKGHDDIWNPTMRSFLVQFLLLSVAPPPKVPDQAADKSKKTSSAPAGKRMLIAR